MSNVRVAVVNALVKIEKDNSYSNLAVNSFINDNSFKSEDYAFASHLIYGVIERKITLDYYIQRIATKPISKLSSFVLNNLRVAIYQICYMDKIPNSAAVNEAVNIVKQSKERYTAGFVNAALRSFLRNTPQLPIGETDYALSIRYSCAKWYINELKQYIGKENVEPFLMDTLNQPPTYIRVNSLKTSQENLIDLLNKNNVITKQTKLNNALEIGLRGSVVGLQEFKSGFFHVQDLASQVAIAALKIDKSDRVLDVCAAPGGKTCTAAQYAEYGSVVSCDLYQNRVALINDNIKRLDINNVTATVNDATIFNNSLGEFDKVICDVVCSGFGVIRRKPEIKYKALDDLTNLPQLQYNILKISTKYLKIGGSLLYSTCTLRAAENEDVVNKFVSDNPNFIIEETSVFNDINKFHRLLPNTHGSDGFFFSVIRRIK